MSSVIVVKQGAGRAVIAAGLRGRPGDPGEQGQDGTPFQVDATGLLANRDAFDGEDEGFSYLATDTGDLYFRQGAVGSWSDPVPFQGPAGDSAYQVAVNNGFVGTEAEWLEALKGADGANGTDGADGTDGLSIIGAAIDGNGHLQLTLSNSTLLDAGLVVGMDGADGADGVDGRGIASMAIDGSNHLIITYTDSSTEDAGLIPGAGGSASWGSIGGTLADQADLAAALADKANSADLATVAVTGSYADLSDKPAIPSTAAEVGAIPSAEKGAANGVAPLDSGAKIAAAYLPSFVDDVLEFANLAAFPATGESGKIYVALDTNKTYRWGGSSYVDIVSSPGSTDAVTEGSINLYHTESRVLNSALAALSLADSTVVTASDNIRQAIGKLAARLALAFDRANHTGTQAISTVTGLQAALDAKATNPMTAAGDLIVGGASGAPARLALGAPLQMPRVNAAGTGIEYADPPAGGGATLPVVRAITANETLGLAQINTFGVNATANNYTQTIPPQSSVAWTDHAEVHYLPTSTGNIVITAGAGVSLNGVVAGSITLSTAFGAASIKRIASDSWWLGGVAGQTGASGDWAAAGGVANTYTLTPVVARESYVTGDQFRARFSVTNTGAMTVNVSGLGVKTCKTVTGADTPAGYIRTDVDTVLTYDGTNFVVGREVEYGSNANGKFWRHADGRLEMSAEVTFDMTVTNSSTNYSYPATPVTSPLSGGIVGPTSLNAAVSADVFKVLLHLQVGNWRIFLVGTGTSGNQSFKLRANAEWY